MACVTVRQLPAALFMWQTAAIWRVAGRRQLERAKDSSLLGDHQLPQSPILLVQC